LERRIASGIMMTLLLTSMLTLAINIQPVKANGTIYIRADGSIDPPTAPISTLDNVTYTLTGNITSFSDGIVIERESIVIDGDGYTVQGSVSGSGFYLLSIDNVTVKNTNIYGFNWGILFLNSSNHHITGNNITHCNWRGIVFGAPAGMHADNNTICENNLIGPFDTGIAFDYSGASFRNMTIYRNDITGYITYAMGLYGLSDSAIYENVITHCGVGIRLGVSSNNTIYANKLANNWGGSAEGGICIIGSNNNTFYDNSITATNDAGIHISESSDNKFWHNNLIDNEPNVRIWYQPVICTWDDGYPSGGNYWSDYSGVDFYSGPYQNKTGSDGKGDIPYIIDENNRDNYPLMNPWEPTILSIAPASTKVSVGQTFKVNITISGVLDLWGWRVKLSWNPSYLKLTYHGPDWTDADIIEGPFLKDAYPDKTLFLFSPPNETGGYIAEILDVLLVARGVSGSGTVATITFNATAPGTSTIGLSETSLLDWINATYKLDIPHTVVNGTVKVTYVGDFDGDFDVDYDDIIYFVDAYIKYWSGQGKDPACDFDSDCDIDYDDILIFVTAYIDYWTPP